MNPARRADLLAVGAINRPLHPYTASGKDQQKHMARDEQVQSAIDNWAPRFISNGVDFNDFQRVTNSVERWDDWCQAWSECGAMHEQMGEQAEAEGYYE